MNGCNIFVTTVPCLAGLLKDHPFFFTRGKVKHFIIENIDMILNRYQKLCIEIIKHFAKRRAETNMQIVITSRTWHEILRKFLTIPDILLLIGKLDEASRYAKSQFTLDISCGDEKCEKLKGKKKIFRYKFLTYLSFFADHFCVYIFS